MKNRKTTGLIISIAVALLGTLLLLRYVSASKETAAPAPAAPSIQTRPALVAKQDIPSGTAAEAIAALIETKEVPVDQAQDALISLDPIKGQVTNAQIFAGEPLRPSRFFSPSAAAAEGVDPGNVGVSVWLDRTELPDGQIFKDDIVGIVGTFVSSDGAITAGSGTETHLTIRKVRVLAVSAPVLAPAAAPGATPAAPDPTGKQMVTLSVPDVDAERVVYLAKFGTITLIRETAESVEGGTKVVNRENIYVPTERRARPATTVAASATSTPAAATPGSTPAAAAGSGAATPTTAKPAAAPAAAASTPASTPAAAAATPASAPAAAPTTAKPQPPRAPDERPRDRTVTAPAGRRDPSPAAGSPPISGEPGSADRTGPIRHRHRRTDLPTAPGPTRHPLPLRLLRTP